MRGPVGLNGGKAMKALDLSPVHNRVSSPKSPERISDVLFAVLTFALLLAFTMFLYWDKSI
jgi:hypothetical protein